MKATVGIGKTSHASTRPGADGRREEIVAACAALYAEKGFHDVTLKDVASRTSFSRPSIYNYFETKEEIFLALFEREYAAWNADLSALAAAPKPLAAEAFARALAATVARRPLLLRLLSTNLYDMEENCRMERLIAFKTEYGRSFASVRAALARHFPSASAASRDGFVRLFFPFMFGIHPYVEVTPKQRAAMTEAGCPPESLTAEALVADFAMQLIARY